MDQISWQDNVILLSSCITERAHNGHFQYLPLPQPHETFYHTKIIVLIKFVAKYFKFGCQSFGSLSFSNSIIAAENLLFRGASRRLSGLERLSRCWRSSIQISTKSEIFYLFIFQHFLNALREKFVTSLEHAGVVSTCGK